MRVNFYKFSDSINYPVSKYIQQNIPSINNLISLVQSVYPINTKLNIWCRGSSGSIIAALFANKYPYSIIHYVRKFEEHSHYNAGFKVHENGPNIIVDDFIATVDTINEIIKEINNCNLNVNAIAVSGYFYLWKLNFRDIKNLNLFCKAIYYNDDNMSKCFIKHSTEFIIDRINKSELKII